MNHGWPLVTLQEIAANVPYPIGDGDHGQIKPAMYESSGVPYIRVADIGWGHFEPKGLVHISESVHEANLKSELKPGDILIAKTGATIGKCCVVPSYVEKANTTSSVGKISVDQKRMHPKFLLYWFLTPEFQKYLWSISTRAAQPGFNIADMKLFKVPLPPLAEQQRLVDLLDKAFEGIAIAKANAEKNLWNASALFESRLQSLFTQSRTRWKRIVLTEVTKKITDGSHNPPPGVPVSKFLMLSSKNVFDDDLDYLNPRYLNAESFDIEHKRTGVIPGDVLLTIVGTIGRCAVVPDGAPHITLQRSVAVIRPDQARLTSRFLMYSLMSRRAELNEQSRGVAQKGIYLESLRNVLVLVPTLEEQVRIVGELDLLQDHTNQLAQIYAQKAKSVGRLGVALLHQAFSGQLAAA